MSPGIWQLLAFAAVLTLTTRPLGSYMADVFEGRRTPLSRFLVPSNDLLIVCAASTRNVSRNGRPMRRPAWLSVSSARSSSMRT